MIHLKAPTKINLTLDILGKDEQTGKHFVNTLVYVHEGLCDEIVLRKKESVEFVITGPHTFEPEETNSVLLALKLLNIRGYSIELHKNIPLQSGLGGGSSDAAAILKYFGELKGIPLHELQKLGAQIGADVPLFLTEGNLVYCEGFGDQVVQSWTIDPLKIGLVETGVKVSTADAYTEIDLGECGKHSAKTEALLNMLGMNSELRLPRTRGTPESASGGDSQHFHNDFEASFFREYPLWQGIGHLCGSGGALWKLKNNQVFASEPRV